MTAAKRGYAALAQSSPRPNRSGHESDEYLEGFRNRRRGGVVETGLVEPARPDAKHRHMPRRISASYRSMATAFDA